MHSSNSSISPSHGFRGYFSDPTFQAPLEKLQEAIQGGEDAANTLLGLEGSVTISGALVLVEEALSRIIQQGSYPFGLETVLREKMFHLQEEIANLEVQ